jgi:hypothetical protein
MGLHESKHEHVHPHGDSGPRVSANEESVKVVVSFYVRGNAVQQAYPFVYNRRMSAAQNASSFRFGIIDPLTIAIEHSGIYEAVIFVTVVVPEGLAVRGDVFTDFASAVLAEGAFAHTERLAVIRLAITGAPIGVYDDRAAFYRNIGRLVRHMARRRMTSDERQNVLATLGLPEMPPLAFESRDAGLARRMLREGGAPV